MSSLIKNESSETCFIDETCLHPGVRNAFMRETMIEIVHSEHTWNLLTRWFNCAQNKQIKDGGWNHIGDRLTGN